MQEEAPVEPVEATVEPVEEEAPVKPVEEASSKPDENKKEKTLVQVKCRKCNRYFTGRSLLYNHRKECGLDLEEAKEDVRKHIDPNHVGTSRTNKRKPKEPQEPKEPSSATPRGPPLRGPEGMGSPRNPRTLRKKLSSCGRRLPSAARPQDPSSWRDPRRPTPRMP